MSEISLKIDIPREPFKLKGELLIQIMPSDYPKYIKQYNDSLVAMLKAAKVGEENDVAWEFAKAFYIFNSLYAAQDWYEFLNSPDYIHNCRLSLWYASSDKYPYSIYNSRKNDNHEDSFDKIKNVVTEIVLKSHEDVPNIPVAKFQLLSNYLQINLGVLFETFLAGVPSQFKNGINFGACYVK